MLPVLVEQLKAVATQTEAAALDLCGRFQRISQRAQEQSREPRLTATVAMDVAGRTWTMVFRSKAEPMDNGLFRLQWGSAFVMVGVAGQAIVAIAPLFRQPPAGEAQALVWKDCQRIALCSGCRPVFRCRSCEYRRTCAGGVCGWGDVCV